MSGIQPIGEVKKGLVSAEKENIILRAQPFIDKIMYEIKSDPDSKSWKVTVMDSLQAGGNVAKYLTEEFEKNGYHIQFSVKNGFATQTQFAISLIS